jgi:hypothetical protein
MKDGSFKQKRFQASQSGKREIHSFAEAGPRIRPKSRLVPHWQLQ